MIMHEDLQPIFYQTRLNFINYWFNYVEKNHLNPVKIGLEISNILNALQQAWNHEQNEQLSSMVHNVYPFCESQGLYVQIETHLLRIQQIFDGDLSYANIQNFLLYGRLSFRQEKYDQARSYWSQGLALAKKSELSELASKLEKELGVLAIEQRSYNEARSYLVCSLRKAKSHHHDQYLLCQIYGELFRLSFYMEEMSKANYYCKKGLALAYELEEGHLITGLLVFQGAIRHKEGDIEKAFDVWYEALELAREVGNLERKAVLLANLGTVANELGRPSAAEKFLIEGIEVARALGNTQVLSHQLMDLGLLCGKQGKDERASTLIRESIILAKQSEHLPLITYNLMKMGDFYLTREALIAFGAYQDCIDHISPEESLDYLLVRRAEAQFGAAKALLSIGRIDEAAQFSKQSLVFFDQADQKKAKKVREWAKHFLS